MARISINDLEQAHDVDHADLWKVIGGRTPGGQGNDISIGGAGSGAFVSEGNRIDDQAWLLFKCDKALNHPANT